jgi:hypothetical protein
MSGEMNTSLGNGLFNLLMTSFVFSEYGYNTDMVVEGDDGLSAIPYSIKPLPTETDFERYGLRLKLKYVNSMSEANFCGIIFSEVDEVNVADPIEKLATFGWTRKPYRFCNDKKLKVLLRAKSLSMAYSYPGCPILWSLANYGLRITRSFDIRHFVSTSPTLDEWERGKLLLALKDEKNLVKSFGEVKIGYDSRLLVERHFGITVSEQIQLENYLDSLTVLTELDHPVIHDHVPAIWFEYFERFHVTYDTKDFRCESRFFLQPSHHARDRRLDAIIERMRPQA